MLKKYVKLFEQLDQEGELNPEQDNPFIITNNIDMGNLTSGQKRAITRDDDILTPAQYAACYVRAKQALADSEDFRGRGDTVLTRSAMNIQGQESENWLKAPAEKLGFFIGRRPSTVSRTIGTFKKLLSGEREISNTNRVYQLALDYFDKFKKMSPAEVMNGAELAITETPNDEEWSEYRDKQNKSNKASVEKTKLERENIKPDIRKNVFALQQAGRSLSDAVRLTIAGLANSTGKDRTTIARDGILVFKDDPLIRNEFKKILKTL